MTASPSPSSELERQLRPTQVVICGSFRRGLDDLRRDSTALRAIGCEILSPRDLDFVREQDGFVFAEHEQDLAPSAIEARHIEALRDADFVWLHAPEGYLGPSGAFELGVAAAAGVPVFARELPRDVGLQGYVRRVASPAAAASAADELFVADPGAGVRSLQHYYRRVAADRGWDDEGVSESMLLLTEEIGELARALRKGRGQPHAAVGGKDGVGAELADVQLYVVHLANVLDLDLGDAVTSKESLNAKRFGPKQSRSA